MVFVNTVPGLAESIGRFFDVVGDGEVYFVVFCFVFSGRVDPCLP